MRSFFKKKIIYIYSKYIIANAIITMEIKQISAGRKKQEERKKDESDAGTNNMRE